MYPYISLISSLGLGKGELSEASEAGSKHCVPRLSWLLGLRDVGFRGFRFLGPRDLRLRV